ncbi:hypothetical protein VMCG_01405 [Cytospora schulzeri]|uniref:Uncharacterized protein n=1 Tax=Cytospora schulzeri TaxID=448051 RepID=A0A423X639_9PEZI|nr:hypothetical protein VMCG_01405 [Valsa malicola]
MLPWVESSRRRAGLLSASSSNPSAILPGSAARPTALTRGRSGIKDVHVEEELVIHQQKQLVPQAGLGTGKEG